MNPVFAIIFMAIAFVGGFVFGGLFFMSIKLKGKAFGTIRVINSSANEKYAAIDFSDPDVEKALEENDYVILRVIKN